MWVIYMGKSRVWRSRDEESRAMHRWYVGTIDKSPRSGDLSVALKYEKRRTASRDLRNVLKTMRSNDAGVPRVVSYDDALIMVMEEELLK